MTRDRRSFLSLSLGGAVLGAPALAGATSPPWGQDAFDRELERLRQVDASLIGYDETDRIAPALEAPTGIATGIGGRLWVVGDRMLALFVGGREARRVALSAAPSCVCESPEGERVYVGLGDRVEVWLPNGTRAARWPKRGEDAQITALAASSQQVFVADAGSRTVQRCDVDGHELGRIGDTSEPPRHFVVPSPFLDLAVSASGVLWVTNPGRHRIESYALDGTPLGAIGVSGAAIEAFCGCCNPTHIAVLPDGRLVTSEKGLPRVKVLAPSGQLECVVAAGERLAASVVGLDLAVDVAGNVLVLDPQQRAVRVFAPRTPRGSHAL